VVCLPTHLHREAVTASAAARVHVFCEKPLARTLAEGGEMIAACAARGVILQLGFVRRFDNGWNTARRLVQEGTLGAPVVWRDFRASFGPGRNPWYFERSQGGGPFLDGMVHNFDFANHMFGRAVKVVSGLAKFKPSTAIDTGLVWVEYDSGHIMANFWSWGVPDRVNSFSGMDMIGPTGALVFPNTFNIMEFRDQFDPERQSIFLLKRDGGAVKPVPYPKNDMFQEQAVDFIRCVWTGTPPRVTGEDGLAALKVALAALQEERL
jgi:predicted dehydrogenase